MTVETISVDVSLPDLDEEEVLDRLAGRAVDLMIDRWITRRLEHGDAELKSELRSDRRIAIYDLLMERIRERITERLDEVIIGVLDERLGDGTIADRVRAKIDHVLDEPVDDQGRAPYRGTLKTRRIDHCLDKAVRAAIIRCVNDEAEVARREIHAAAQRALGEALETAKARLVGVDR